ncbi:MAG: transcription termination/antitermination protein NusG [Lactobacillales bacterium]|jgi:transcriptional antiterminator NusG|nr:transcription termination/antitermination protein NusG [Lactobacillales bacterium]
MAVRWYVIHAYSGFEKKVAEFLLEQADKKGLKDKLEEVLVPVENVVGVKNGVKVESQRKFFPGYVLAKMEMTDEMWHLVKSTPKVTGFLGGKKPTPITEAEAMRILNQVKEGVEKPKSLLIFEVGEQVNVIDGPFSSFVGTVEGVDAAKERLKVLVMIFGRPTPVELNYTQVKKA